MTCTSCAGCAVCSSRTAFTRVLTSVPAARLAAGGPATSHDLAEAALPWMDRWAIGSRPVTTEDVRRELVRDAATIAALDLAEPATGLRAGTWRPGPPVTTLLPRAAALARHVRLRGDAAP